MCHQEYSEKVQRDNLVITFTLEGTTYFDVTCKILLLQRASISLTPERNRLESIMK